MLFICKGMVGFLELRCLCSLTSLTLHKGITKKAVVRCVKQIEVDNYDEIRTCNLPNHYISFTQEQSGHDMVTYSLDGYQQDDRPW